MSSRDFTFYLKQKVNKSISLEKFTLEDIQNMINGLNSAKSCGPNSIPTNLLKTHSSIFADPLKDLINESLVEGKFPDLLKIAKVCPVYKKGDNFFCENYRPISLLSNISKLFERAMHTRITEFLNAENILYDL